MQNTILQPNTPDQKNELEFLGLTQEMFTTLGLKILTAYNQTTSNDAKMASGMYAYLTAVRGMRDVLPREDWEPLRQSNIELVTNVQQEINILVSSGNKYIGREEGDPGNKNPKGAQTQKIIFENSRQFPLFEDSGSLKKFKTETMATWFLFYHLDVKNTELRMELSLPTSFDFDELKVSGWVKRIILDSIETDETQIDIEPDFAPEIKIDIRRK